MTPSKFAGTFDRSRRGDTTALKRALGDRGARTVATGSLSLAWTGGDGPAGEPLGFLDGRIYAGAPSSPGTNVAAVLSARFRSEGEAVLHGLRGDFLLLFHDPRADEVVFARDQLGGRALFWHHRSGRLTFASEVRYLLPLLDARPDPDLESIAHWLALSGQPRDRTMFAGIHRLEEGATLRYGSGAPVTRRYWNPRYSRPVDATRATYAGELRAVLREAVRRRCVSTPTPGVLLSGGLDSSSVAAAAMHLDTGDRPTRAYTAAFPNHPSVDEGDLVDIACDRLGLVSTRALVRSGSVVAGAFEYVEHWQLPPPSPNLFFWLPLLRRAASDGVTALLDGEGGDELFGLSPYLIADRVRHARVRSAFDLARRIPGGGGHLSRSDLWPFVRYFGVKGAPPPWVHQVVRRLRGRRRYAPEWLRPDVREAFLSSDVTVEWKRLPGPRWWAYLVAATTRGLGAPITYDHVRRRATLAGLEALHPLVDVDVVELVLSMPPELAYDTRYSRPVLRDAMEGWLPDELRLRPEKSFFDAIFHDALVGELELVRSLLHPAEARLARYVDLELIGSRHLATPPAPAQRQDWAQHLWRLVTAECWLRSQEPRGLGAQGLPARAPAALELRTEA